MRCTAIEESFVKCGIYPYCPNVILVYCTAKTSADESTKILCSILDIAKISPRNGEISAIMTNVEVFQKEHDQLIAKRMREANRTSGKRSKKANKQVVTSKKLRVKSTKAVEREPLLLRVPLPTDSAKALQALVRVLLGKIAILNI